MRLDSITLTSGDRIKLSKGVTIVVGPNSSGKSTLLKEVNNYISRYPHSRPDEWQPKVVAEAQIDFEESPNEFLDNLKRKVPHFESEHHLGRPGTTVFRVGISGTTITTSDIENIWDQNCIGQLSEYFVSMLSVENRTNLLVNTGHFNSFEEVPTSPIQHLWAKRALEKELDRLAYGAFKKNIILNRHAGANIPLCIGKLPVRDSLNPREDIISYLHGLPKFDSEGDGFKSFIGMAATIMTSQAPLILIDEPEAFLHPPQARRFGRFLAGQHKKGAQVIVATHSEDIVSGVTSVRNLSKGPSVVRITRSSSGANQIAQLESMDVRDIYNDPLMKYYGMLNGLFADGIILCEADSDCTFYNAVLDSSGNPTTGQDLHFTHCGGKGRIAKAFGTFTKMSVPVVAIVDIDILDKKGEFKALVEAAGGRIEELLQLRDEVADELNGIVRGPKKTDAINAIQEQFNRDAYAYVLPADVAEVKKVINVRNGWRELKRHGVEAISGTCPLSPNAINAFESLDEKLKGLGIFMVRVGELEGFHPELRVKKKEWLGRVLKTGSHKRSPHALSMLTEVSNYIARK